MISAKIRLSSIEDVRNFVNAVTAFDVEVDLSSGRYTVDGKSIMGIFSLDLVKPIDLVAHCETCDDLLAAIKPYII